MALTQVNSIGIKDDSIVNADIKSDAAIALSKLASTPAVLTTSTNNTVCTVTGANAIAGEANLTFDGTSLGVGTASPSGASGTALEVNGGSGQARLVLKNDTTGSGSTDGHQIYSDGNTFGIQNREAGNLVFETNGGERFRITQDGRYIQGHTSSITTWGGGLNHQLHGTSWDASSQSQVRWSNDANSSSLIFAKSRGGIGTQTIVADNDNVGQIAWLASDGTDFNNDVARIDCYIDGTPGSNVVPGELVFSTTKSTGQAYPNMKIRNDGDVEILNGNVVIGTSGKGIDFSADAGGGSSGSAGSELLDDYEEGSWTPTYSDGSSYIDTSGSNFQYLKVGNLVNLWGNIRTDGSATGTAGFYVQSLPFSSVSSTSAHFNGTLMGDNGWSENLSGSNLVCQISSNSANLRLWKNSGNTVGSITLNNIGPNANIMFSISYRCA